MQRFTRQELFDLAWSDPMRTLAKRFGLSDVGLKKHFVAMDVPVPERGYWARKQAGKAVARPKLPPRGPGMPETTTLGRQSAHSWRYDPEAVLNEPLPVEPTFSEPLDEVRARVASRLSKVPSVKTLEVPHPAVRRYLEADEKRREKQRTSPYMVSYYEPYFESGFEQRRLRILNSLYLALARAGAKPAIQGDKARDLSVAVGTSTVSFRLDYPGSKPNRHGEWSTRPGKADTLELLIIDQRDGRTIKRWADSEGRRLEGELLGVAVELIVRGEEQYRLSARHRYEWHLEQRAEAAAELEKRRIEAERKARESRAREEREARESLLGQAHAHREAQDIRSLVAAIRDRADGLEPRTAVDTWAEWALAVADCLDPLRNIAVVEGRLVVNQQR